MAWRRICVRLTATSARANPASTEFGRVGLPKSLTAQTSTLVRRGRQQKKDCSVSLIGGSRSTMLRAVHDDRPFGCRDGPPPCPTTPAHGHIKDRKLIRPRQRPAPLIPSVIWSFHMASGSKLEERRHYPNVSTKSLIPALRASLPFAPGGARNVISFKQDRTFYRRR